MHGRITDKRTYRSSCLLVGHTADTELSQRYGICAASLMLAVALDGHLVNKTRAPNESGRQDQEAIVINGNGRTGERRIDKWCI